MQGSENIFLIDTIKKILKQKERLEEIDHDLKKGLERFFTKSTIRTKKLFRDLFNLDKKSKLEDFINLYDLQDDRLKMSLEIKYKKSLEQ